MLIKVYWSLLLLGITTYATSQTTAYDMRSNERLNIRYADTVGNLYLRDLNQRYHLNDLVKPCKDQESAALTICHWVHTQWNHNGSNLPSKSDALSILEEAKAGKLFRCVEYGITIAAALNAQGIKSRTLGLKMQGADTISSGAGHVVTEAWLSDLKKWVMIDGQFDVIPYNNNIPLSAFELQQAINTNSKSITMRSISGDITTKDYIEWIKPYLYFFDIELNNQEEYGLEKRLKRQGIMLTPLHEKCLTVFQNKSPMSYQCTHSVRSFYAKPS